MSLQNSFDQAQGCLDQNPVSLLSISFFFKFLLSVQLAREEGMITGFQSIVLSGTLLGKVEREGLAIATRQEKYNFKVLASKLCQPSQLQHFCQPHFPLWTFIHPQTHYLYQGAMESVSIRALLRHTNLKSECRHFVMTINHCHCHTDINERSLVLVYIK